MVFTDSLGSESKFDAVLIGAGIMSSTLAALLHELEPEMRILVIERLDAPALESSAAINNSGTGHAANCEFNYTPCSVDGSINIQKALEINHCFEQSLEFWASLTERDMLSPSSFLHVLPHISFVKCEEDIEFLRERYRCLHSEAPFQDMEWSEDNEELKEWIPLIIDGRHCNDKVAATRMKRGTDIDFGALTSSYLNRLIRDGALEMRLSTEVVDIHKSNNNSWQLSLVNEKRTYSVQSPFLFLGAGGGALNLLQKSGVPEAENYGGFPVSGQWLVCNDPSITEKHNAKVYGKSALGAPPMSVPHLDTRWVDGNRSLLFGPFAGANTKFLKNGSKVDFFRSINLQNFTPMVQAGIKNFDLIKYLLAQVRLDHNARVKLLRTFYPEAKANDWTLAVAGQRVQIIKQTSHGGVLKMGTEVVTSSDGSMAALLGASPGASTAVSIMLEVLQHCYSKKMSTQCWQNRLRKLIPSFKLDIHADKSLLSKIRQRNDSLLGLTN